MSTDITGASGNGGAGGLPRVVYAQASPRSLGGTSLFDVDRVEAGDVAAFTSEADVQQRAAEELARAGFQVLQVAPTSINIGGPPELYQQVFGTPLHTVERDVIKPGAMAGTATFVDTPDSEPRGYVPTAASPLADVVEGVAIEEPVYPMAAQPLSPNRDFWCLDVPGDVSMLLNADRAHRSGVTGAGVRVLMVDSGWFEHPYFARRGYRYTPAVLGPSATAPTVDEDGHGTAESANLLAVAPDVEFTMVKANFVNSTGAFNEAVRHNPHVLSCSWGSDVCGPPLSAAHQAQAAAVAAAVAAGVVVVFSAGNGHAGFPGQHPDVISAGGVFVDEDGGLQASNYASGFASQVFPGRRCPDVSGLVGMRPAAAYIMLPLAPGSAIDVELSAAGAHPDGDETPPDDGWAAISGTSAAAPQLAGVVALMKQVAPALTPAEVRAAMMATAVDVSAGSANEVCGVAQPAAAGPDLATGHGLVDAHAAVQAAIAATTSQPAPA